MTEASPEKEGGAPRMDTPRRAILGLFPAWPVNRSVPKTPGILPSSGGIGRAERADHFETGGWGGIRTHDTLLTYTHFPGARLRPLGHPSSKIPALVTSCGFPRTISFSPCFNRVSSPAWLNLCAASIDPGRRATGLVAYLCRSDYSFRLPGVQRPGGFCPPKLNAFGAGYRSR